MKPRVAGLRTYINAVAATRTLITKRLLSAQPKRSLMTLVLITAVTEKSRLSATEPGYRVSNTLEVEVGSEVTHVSGAI